MTTEVEDLDALVKSPGFRRLAQWAEKEWADKFSHLVTVAVGDIDDVMALQKLRQLTVAKSAVEQLLKWPAERLNALQRGEQTRNPDLLSRRGPL